jgi:hypothetical protein
MERTKAPPTQMLAAGAAPAAPADSNVGGASTWRQPTLQEASESPQAVGKDVRTVRLPVAGRIRDPVRGGGGGGGGQVYFPRRGTAWQAVGSRAHRPGSRSWRLVWLQCSSLRRGAGGQWSRCTVPSPRPSRT